ncbi:hypothetical protein LEMLEM_LOCUS21763 [Lemmus lemmus]
MAVSHRVVAGNGTQDLWKSSISIAAGVCLQGPLSLTEADHVGESYCMKSKFSPFP